MADEARIGPPGTRFTSGREGRHLGRPAHRSGSGDDGRLTLLSPGRRTPPHPGGQAPPAQRDPVAAVAVDMPLAHLDRPFEYAVPADLEDTAVPGVRVKVRFAGQDVDGYVLARHEVPEHHGTLRPLRRLVSPEPVLTGELAAVCRRIADDHVGALVDVVRLAVPPRHAAAEKALAAHPPPAAAVPVPTPGPWAAYPAGESFLRRLAAGGSPSAAWTATPGHGADPAALDADWPSALAVAAAATLAGGRGVVLVVPDHRDVARVDAALTTVLGRGRHVRLTADQGPQARYTAWLKCLRGHVRCAVGSRAAAFAPVADPGLLAWWDDGDDLHAEPRAPYPHVRDVLAARAQITGACLLAAGHSRTAAVQRWVREGRLREIRASSGSRRRVVPAVRVAGEGADAERDGPGAFARLPGAAWRAAQAGLKNGPVLVQVPRRGYVPSLSCVNCRAPARCAHCHGPLSLEAAGRAPVCRWCATAAADHRCGHCGSSRLRSGAVGARRTAEELGRAFPGVAVRSSGGAEVLATVPADPALVVATPGAEPVAAGGYAATPGAEPVAAGGYAATLLLDAWAMLDRPRLDASQEALRRWAAAAALTRGRDDGGVVVLAGAPDHTTLPAVEALVRWEPEWHAERELSEREELSLPPTTWTARLEAPHGALVDALAELSLPPEATVLGPLPVDVGPAGRPTGAPADRVAAEDLPEAQRPAQAFVRAPWQAAPAVRAQLAAMRGRRSARRQAPVVTVRVGVADVV